MELAFPKSSTQPQKLSDNIKQYYINQISCDINYLEKQLIKKTSSLQYFKKKYNTCKIFFYEKQLDLINEDIKNINQKLSDNKIKIENIKNNDQETIQNILNKIQNNKLLIQKKNNTKKQKKIDILNKKKKKSKKSSQHFKNNFLARKENRFLNYNLNIYYKKFIRSNNSLSYHIKNKLKNLPSNIAYKINGILYFGQKNDQQWKNKDWIYIENINNDKYYYYYNYINHQEYRLDIFSKKNNSFIHSKIYKLIN